MARDMEAVRRRHLGRHLRTFRSADACTNTLDVQGRKDRLPKARTCEAGGNRFSALKTPEQQGLRRKQHVGGFIAARSSPAAPRFAAVVRAQRFLRSRRDRQRDQIGHTNPYSGPLSAYGVIGKGIAAYWTMVSDQGGINGRKINFITYDDGFQPPKTVEMVRQLVEHDQVLAIFQLSARRPTRRCRNTSTERRCRSSSSPPARRSGACPRSSRGPWAGSPTTRPAAIYAQHLLANHPNGKVAMLYQNDDSGKDYLNGFIAGFGRNRTSS